MNANSDSEEEISSPREKAAEKDGRKLNLSSKKLEVLTKPRSTWQERQTREKLLESKENNILKALLENDQVYFTRKQYNKL